MRRNSLLAAGMLSVLLATSACGAGPAPPNSSAQSSGSANAGVEASSSTGLDRASAEIGASQRAAAEKAKAAAVAAKKAKAAAKKAPPRRRRRTLQNGRCRHAAGRTGRKHGSHAGPGGWPRSSLHALPRLPAAPKPAPAPVVPASSSERIVHTTYTTAYTWYDNTPVGSTTISHPVLHKTAGGTGTYS